VKKELEGRQGEERKQFFFEKKNQKTFVIWRTLPERAATAVQKFFASFFQKRRPSSLAVAFQQSAADLGRTRPMPTSRTLPA
jgi:hypothetical protein